MTDIERIELAIRRVLAKWTGASGYHTAILHDLADELAKAEPFLGHPEDERHLGGPKINWVP